MKINKFTKKKNGMYRVELEDGSFLIAHEDLVLKHELLIKKQVSEEEKEQILEENLQYIAYDLALHYLTIKMRCPKEVEEYLAKKQVAPSIIEEVIRQLEKEKYLDEDQYIDSFIHDKMNLTNDGPRKIAKNLIDLGMREEKVREQIEKFGFDIQEEKAFKIAQKMMKTNRHKSSYFMKNKIIDYLSQLGYDKSVAVLVTQKLDSSSDSEIQKKEYEKIYRKLARKYSGTELEYKVKQKMYSLGFRNYD